MVRPDSLIVDAVNSAENRKAGGEVTETNNSALRIYERDVQATVAANRTHKNS